MLTSPAETKQRGPLDIKWRKISRQAQNWPNSIMIVMDAHVCQPLTRCISEND